MSPPVGSYVRNSSLSLNGTTFLRFFIAFSLSESTSLFNVDILNSDCGDGKSFGGEPSNLRFSGELSCVRADESRMVGLTEAGALVVTRLVNALVLMGDCLVTFRRAATLSERGLSLRTGEALILALVGDPSIEAANVNFGWTGSGFLVAEDRL